MKTGWEFIKYVILSIGIVFFVLIPLAFFYTQNNTLFLQSLKKDGITKSAIVLEKKQVSYFFYTNYAIKVKTSSKEENTYTVQNFVHKKMYDSIFKGDAIKIVYSSDNNHVIFEKSLEKKNLPLIQKKTIIYVLLICGFLCLITYKIIQ